MDFQAIQGFYRFAGLKFFMPMHQDWLS
jgi:hypothetical protein